MNDTPSHRTVGAALAYPAEESMRARELDHASVKRQISEPLHPPAAAWRQALWGVGPTFHCINTSHLAYVRIDCTRGVDPRGGSCRRTCSAWLAGWKQQAARPAMTSSSVWALSTLPCPSHTLKLPSTEFGELLDITSRYWRRLPCVCLVRLTNQPDRPICQNLLLGSSRASERAPTLCHPPQGYSGICSRR